MQLFARIFETLMDFLKKKVCENAKVSGGLTE